MLDALQGFGNAAGNAAAPTGKLLSIEEMQKAFYASPEGAHMAKTLTEFSTPPAGSSPVVFATRYAASFPAQVATLTKRCWLAANRNVSLNFNRLTALLALNIIFGIVWLNARGQATSVSGVQSLVSGIFMSATFTAMVCMNTAVPGLIQVRAVFYREQASGMYDPASYSIALIASELPWIALVVFVPSVVGYFMMNLVPTAAVFFFHCLVIYALAITYVSMGQLVAALVPSFEVAQAVLGLIGPLFFLFGGLWSPPSQMIPGASWFCYIDPVIYAFRALVRSMGVERASGVEFACAVMQCCVRVTLVQLTPADPPPSLADPVASVLRKLPYGTSERRWRARHRVPCSRRHIAWWAAEGGCLLLRQQSLRGL